VERLRTLVSAAPRTLRWAALPLLLPACAGPQRPPAERLPPGELERFRGSDAAEQLGTQGWIVVEELRRDLGGGEELESVVVEGRLVQGPEPEELRVAIWRPTERGWELLARSEPVAGSAVELLEVARCGEGQSLLFAAVEEEPDQRRHRLLVFEGLPGLRKALGAQVDQEAAPGAGFAAVDGGFVFRTGEAELRWRCVDGRYVKEEVPAEPEERPSLPSSGVGG